MPIEKFEIYDLIVDIIPGLLLIALLTPAIIPYAALDTVILRRLGISVALVVLAFGYTLGRVVHGIASPIDSFIRWVVRSAHEPLVSYSVKHQWFPYNRVRALLNPIIGTHYNLEQHAGGSLSMITPDTLKTAIAHRLFTNLEEEFDLSSDDLKGEYVYVDIEHLAYSILYDENVLYRKYEMLTTFFRSMYVISFASALLYLQTWKSTIGMSKPQLTQQTALLTGFFVSYRKTAAAMVVLLLFLTVVFLIQKRKFSNRRFRALLYDTFLQLEER